MNTWLGVLIVLIITLLIGGFLLLAGDKITNVVGKPILGQTTILTDILVK